MSLDDLIGKHFDKRPGKKTAAPAADKPAEEATPAPVPSSPPKLRLVETPAAVALQEVLVRADERPAPPPERETVILRPGLYMDVPHVDYLRDPAERPSLSSSVAAILAERAPLHAWYAHPRLGAGKPINATPSTGRGSVFHKLLLGKGQDVAVFDYDDFKTKAARLDRDAAIAEGKIPLTAAKFDEYSEAIEVIRRRMKAQGIELKGESEVTGVWERDGVLCRMRIDHLIVSEGEALLLDIKSCTNAAPEKVQNDFCTYADDIQAVAYPEGIETLMPEFVGRTRMQFVFVEAEPPHDVVLFDPDGKMRDHGGRRWRRARETWKRCFEHYGTAEWPGHSQRPVRLGPPAWAVIRESETQQNRMETDVKPPF